jgi:hypothetical protein
VKAVLELVSDNDSPNEGMAVVEFRQWLLSFSRRVERDLPGWEIADTDGTRDIGMLRFSLRCQSVADEDLRAWAEGWSEREPRTQAHKLVSLRAWKTSRRTDPPAKELSAKVNAAAERAAADAQLILDGKSAEEIVALHPF